MECLGGFALPKATIISNKRLGILHRLLQVMCGLAAAASVAYNSSWLIHKSPLPFGFAFWLSPADDALQFDDNAKHCSDASSYHYSYNSDWVYNPSSCKQIDSARALLKTRGSSQWVFAPTFIQETTRASTHGAECGEKFGANCTTRGGTYSMQGKVCRCTVLSEYFVQNAEMNYLTMVHGYTVSKDSMHTSNQKGVSTRTAQTHTWHGGEYKEDVEIETTFRRKSDGTLCKFGGRDVWKPEDVKQGMPISFKELLDCLGLDLDQQYEELRSFDPAENMAPYLRQSGLIINAYMRFENKLSRGILSSFTEDKVWCTVLLDGSLTWNSQQEHHFSEIPTIRSNWEEEVDIYMYGISFNVQVIGDFGYPDLVELINAAVKVIVLATLPTKIMYIVCLYMLGVRSKVYRRVLRERFAIPSYLSGLIGRELSHTAAFQMISRQQHLHMHQLQSMPTKEFEGVIRILLKENIGNGVLSEAELSTLCSYLHKHYDEDRDGAIDLHKWVTMSSSNEPMNLHDIACLFDVDRRRSIGERIFDDGIWKHINEVYKSHERMVTIRKAQVENEVDDAPLQVASSSKDSESSPSAQNHPVSREEFDALQERLLDLEARLENRFNGNQKQEDALERKTSEVIAMELRQLQLSAPEALARQSVRSEVLEDLQGTLQQHASNCTQLVSRQFLEDFHKIVEGHSRALQQLCPGQCPHSMAVEPAEGAALQAGGGITEMRWDIAQLKDRFSALDKEVSDLSSALRSWPPANKSTPLSSALTPVKGEFSTLHREGSSPSSSTLGSWLPADRSKGTIGHPLPSPRVHGVMSPSGLGQYEPPNPKLLASL